MHGNYLRASERETLDYMMAMMRELREMAQGSRFPTISYFLEMAYTETFDVFRGVRPARPEKPTKRVNKSNKPSPSELAAAYAKLEASL